MIHIAMLPIWLFFAIGALTVFLGLIVAILCRDVPIKLRMLMLVFCTSALSWMMWFLTMLIFNM